MTRIYPLQIASKALIDGLFEDFAENMAEVRKSDPSATPEGMADLLSRILRKRGYVNAYIDPYRLAVALAVQEGRSIPPRSEAHNPIGYRDHNRKMITWMESVRWWLVEQRPRIARRKLGATE